MGQHVLQLDGLRAQAGELVLIGQGFLQRSGGGFDLRSQLLQTFPRRVQSLLVLLPQLALLDLSDQLLQLSIDLRLLPVQGGLAAAVLLQEPVQQRDQLPAGELAPPGLLRGVPAFIVPGALNGGPVPADVRPQRVALPLQLSGGLLEPVLERLIQSGVKDLPEDLHPLLRGRLQQLPEIPLGDHGHLRKLTAVKSQQRLHLAGDVGGTGDHGTVRAVEFPVRLLPGHAGPSRFGPVIVRIAADGIVPIPVAEGQLHKGRCLRLGVLAAEHLRLHVFPAGPAKQGEGDGVEDRGLARAGIAADHVQPFPAQFVQLQLHLSRVGAEGGYGQLYWSHARSSCIVSSSSVRYRRCSSDMGWWFCC